MTAFDPWTATLEEAAAQEQADWANPNSALEQWEAAQKLTGQKAQIESGDGFGVLRAVARCALYRLVIPDWLVPLYLKRIYAVQCYAAGSWDDPAAFGRPYPKGTQIAARRRRRLAKFPVVRAVHDALAENPARPIDDAFWEQIAAEIGYQETVVQELYAEAVAKGWTKKAAEIRTGEDDASPGN